MLTIPPKTTLTSYKNNDEFMMDYMERGHDVLHLDNVYHIETIKSKIKYTIICHYLLDLVCLLFVGGWLNELFDYQYGLYIHFNHLSNIGPPNECTDNDPSSWFDWRTMTSKQICEAYYTDLLQSSHYYIPHVWKVTVLCITNTITEPIQNILNMIGSLSYFLQYCIMCIIIICLSVFILSRMLSKFI